MSSVSNFFKKNKKELIGLSAGITLIYTALKTENPNAGTSDLLSGFFAVTGSAITAVSSSLLFTKKSSPHPQPGDEHMFI